MNALALRFESYPVFFMCVLMALMPAMRVASAQDDPFAAGVRATDPLTPDQQRRAFHLPPGFTIELVAAEPEIAKPMNLAFDAAGRLWVTQSLEYPHAAPLDQPGRDAIRILEDTDHDGRADRIITFAENLNIPIGILPLVDGAIGWSIPNIWRFRDLDGDLRADERSVVLGPLGWERDTHGMNASFRRGFDGWIYATHGFNNESTFVAGDGSRLTLQSGNVYRFLKDGSRVEAFSRGQVNPFGMCLDEFGNVYTADCHSKPIYQLLRGACYPSFGKPHDGLGFGPVMVEHLHGSTAIAGIAMCQDDAWPAEYRNNLFIGNVMTSRVNRDAVRYHGSSPVGVEMDDFIRCDDPWFRPVDLQFGPDGALYIADFYNRIIGHYEVPLDHPGRDRFRGRIWRVTHRGSGDRRAPDLTGLSVDRLVDELAHPSFTRRMLAMHFAVDSHGSSVADAVEALLQSGTANVHQHSHGLWILHRLNRLGRAQAESAAAHESAMVRVHAQRVLSETFAWTDWQRSLALVALSDPDPRVQRAAADALGRHPHPSQIQPVLNRLGTVPADDDHLVHTLRMALRNQWLSAGAFDAVRDTEWSAADRARIADVLPGVPTPEAAGFLVRYLRDSADPEADWTRFLEHAARHLPVGEIDVLQEIVRQRQPSNVETEWTLFQLVRNGLDRRGESLDVIKPWASGLAERLFRAGLDESGSWTVRTIDVGNGASGANPWVLQRRAFDDGAPGPRLISSLPPGGEQLTSALRSPPFRVPARLTFWIAGHDGFPDRRPGRKNFVRLLDAESDETIAIEFAPRQDVAQRVDWPLESHQNRLGQIEIVDGDTGTAFAWIAAGRFDPPVVTIPDRDLRTVASFLHDAADLTRRFRLAEHQDAVRRVLTEAPTDPSAAAAAAAAWLRFHPNPALAPLLPLLRNPAVASEQHDQLRAWIAGAESPGPESVTDWLTTVFGSVPTRRQRGPAIALAESADGSSRLADLILDGRASPELLAVAEIRTRLQNFVPDKLRAIDAIHDPASRSKNESTRLDTLLDERRLAYASGTPDPASGAAVFAQACAPCHQFHGNGRLVGPQLDGIAGRGLERLMEDILAPNRNVDVAFHQTILELEDGESVTGMVRSRTGDAITLVDASGAEQIIAADRVRGETRLTSSLMPDNFGDALPEQAFFDLIHFLSNSPDRGSASDANRFQ